MMSHLIWKDPKCQNCGTTLHWSSTRSSCGKPECNEFAAKLAKARWEGHLLRNNVDLYNDVKRGNDD